MSDLRAELGAALHTVVPGEPPIEVVIRRGLRIRLRRRVTAIAATVAVTVAVVVGYPGLSGKMASPAPATPRYPAVTVIPALTGTGQGLIAMGTIGGTPWRITLGNLPQAVLCIQGIIGTDSVSGGCYAKDALLSTGPDTSPAAFEGSNDSRYLVVVGAVAPNVTYLAVDLADGQQLKLIPVDRNGLRLVGVAMPAGLRAVSLTAYLGGAHFTNGQTLTAVPFYPPGATTPVLVRWSQPGQALPPTATRVIGAGTANGRHWSVTAYEGPWGTCLQTSDGGDGCWADARRTTTGITLVSPQIIAGSAGPSIASLEVTLTDGTSVRVPVVAVGNERLWAVAHRADSAVRRWTAYDASGKQVGSGG